ncbi:hypothetical protein AB0E96_40615, partial [Kitasatospora sp. NPDC036755]|uniref:hypothetical protein n=1 Tax=Kitasatospora sp. NPDC036755 TaxID=3154600 RepID=UPI0033D53C38
LVQIVATQDVSNPTVLAPDGTTVTCDDPVGPGWGRNKTLRCATTLAGTYTLKVGTATMAPATLAVSYLPLQSTTACRTVGAADLALGAPTVFHGSLALGSAGDCYRVNDLAAGDVLRTEATQPGVTPVVYDGTGAQVCSKSTYPDCRLTGPAPFRITAQRFDGAAQEYAISAARLSRPDGCVTIEPQAFGVSPDLSSTARCRTLRVPETAPYTFRPVKPDGDIGGTLFAADGSPMGGFCPQGSCDLAPGDYTWAVAAYRAPVGAFGMIFRSARETRGCAAANDTGLTAGPATGTFGGPGQELCLTLPTASGKGVYLFNQPPADGAPAVGEVLDALGATQCGFGDSTTVCKLAGTAPFRVVLSGTPSKAFGLAVHRTEETGGCTVWSRTGFDITWGATVSMPVDSKQAACLSLPADQHSTSEVIDFSNLDGRFNGAELKVLDAAGGEVCTFISVDSSAKACTLTVGVPYTALLIPRQAWSADSYKLARRDVSSTAQCLTPSSTAFGRPGTSFDLISALDARCVRIDGAATTDKFWLGSRPGRNLYGPGVLAAVLDADGKNICTQFWTSCLATGSTSYTMVLFAAGYQDQPIHTTVDTWKVGTADGWAPECTAHPISIDGFPQRSGVLTEDSDGYCAVVDMKPSQSFGIIGTSSSVTSAQPDFSLLSGAHWTRHYDGTACW